MGEGRDYFRERREARRPSANLSIYGIFAIPMLLNKLTRWANRSYAKKGVIKKERERDMRTLCERKTNKKEGGRKRKELCV